MKTVSIAAARNLIADTDTRDTFTDALNSLSDATYNYDAAAIALQAAQQAMADAQARLFGASAAYAAAYNSLGVSAGLRSAVPARRYAADACQKIGRAAQQAEHAAAIADARLGSAAYGWNSTAENGRVAEPTAEPWQWPSND